MEEIPFQGERESEYYSLSLSTGIHYLAKPFHSDKIWVG